METKFIINLFGGPGVGKSTAAYYLMAKLKLNGIDCEYTPEFAKDKVWEGNLDVFNCQFFVTGRQAWQIRRLYNKVTVIITDSPIALGATYADSPELAKTCLVEFNKYKDVNKNFIIERNTVFDPNGRRQSETESRKLDKNVEIMLAANNIPFSKILNTTEQYDNIVNSIISEIRGDVECQTNSNS